jgi:UDP-N-acetylmuramyl pentapeptide synthase
MVVGTTADAATAVGPAAGADVVLVKASNAVQLWQVAEALTEEITT